MPEAANNSKRLSFFIVALTLALFLILLFVFQRYVFVPKIIIILLIVLGAALMRRLPLLIKDWFVFISFVYLFDSLRGTIYILTCKLGLPVHTTYVIGIEKALFGQVPSNVLQARLLDPAKAPEFTWLEKSPDRLPRQSLSRLPAHRLHHLALQVGVFPAFPDVLLSPDLPGRPGVFSRPHRPAVDGRE